MTTIGCAAFNQNVRFVAQPGWRLGGSVPTTIGCASSTPQTVTVRTDKGADQ